MTDSRNLAPIHNGQALPQTQVPDLSWADFRRTILDAVAARQRVAALFGETDATTGTVELYVVLADRSRALLGLAKTRLTSDHFASMTPDCPQVHLFEREIAEQFGVRPEGHPWFKPVRFAKGVGQIANPSHEEVGRIANPSHEEPVIGVTDYYRVEGEEIHEVAVGPVHAGVIEPGHFRFQCHGEVVYHLEVSLGYQHRGVERAMLNGPHKRSIHYAETLAGDTSIGHATAYCQTAEALSGCQVPVRAQALRAIALELERLANHTGDLGALAGDVGFLPTQSFCGRLRGDFLNATATLCGSRFGRGLVRPGGVGFDVDEARTRPLVERLTAALKDVNGAAKLLWQEPTVQARFEDTCPVAREGAEQIGLVGVAARASGLDLDVRHDFPSGYYRFAQLPISTWPSGDVFARAYVRGLEIQRSGDFVLEHLKALPAGKERTVLGALQPHAVAVALVEGWRGEICHVALTDAQGLFRRYKIVDPSFHNWFGMHLALRNQQISDFPLCNKSFNLSYCGYDL